MTREELKQKDLTPEDREIWASIIGRHTFLRHLGMMRQDARDSGAMHSMCLSRDTAERRIAAVRYETVQIEAGP